MGNKKKKKSADAAAAPQSAAIEMPLPFAPAVIGAVILCGAGVAAYFNSLRGEFIFDDIRNILENPYIQRVWPPWDSMFKGTNTTRPVVGLSLAFNYNLGGPNPAGFHIFNIGVHIFAALTLFGIVRRTLNTPPLREKFGVESTMLALAVALLWVVHPLQTQSVTYLIQRAESMMGLFYLLTLYLVIRGTCSRNPWLWYLPAIFTSALGMGSKAVMATAPFVIFLYDRTFLAGSFGEALRRRFLLYGGMLATLPIIPILFAMAPPLTSAGFEMKKMSAFEYALTQPEVLLHYLKLCFYPVGQCLDYMWLKADSAERIIPGVIVIGGLVAASLYACVKKREWGFVGMWFFLILSVTSTVMPIADLAFEHRMYLSLAAVCAAVVFGVHALFELLAKRANMPRQTMIYAENAVFVLMAGVLIFLSIQRNRLYLDPVVMWEDVIAKSPANHRAYDNLGLVLINKENMTPAEYDYAMKNFEKAIELKPDNAIAMQHIAMAYSKTGKPNEAIAQYEKALSVKPGDADALCNLGVLLMDAGRFPEAREKFETAIKNKPNHSAAKSNFASLAVREQDPKAAIELCLNLLKQDPNVAETHYNLGMAYLNSGQRPKAMSSFQEAAKLSARRKQPFIAPRQQIGTLLYRDGKLQEALEVFNSILQDAPGDINAAIMAATTLMGQNKLDAAAGMFEDIIKRSPREFSVRCNYGLMLQNQGKVAESIEQLKVALECKSDSWEVHANLGTGYFKLGNNEEAVRHFALAQRLKNDDPTTRFVYGLTLKRLNRIDDAAQQFQAAAQLADARGDARISTDSRNELRSIGK